MRWLVWVVTLVVFIGAAAFGVGYFFLPNTLDVSRSVLIERPRATVYAQVSDLRNVRSWSPYYAMDPNAEWTFTGDPGPGQTMRWVSTSSEVGSGAMTITRLRANERVDMIMRFGERVSLDSHVVIRPAEAGANVTWVVQAGCRPDPVIVVPCRYMNFMLQRSIARDLDAGLARLKSMTEELPEADFEGLRPDLITVEQRPFVYVEATIVKPSPTADDLRAAEARGVAQLRQFLAEVQPAVTTAGPLHRVTAVWDPQNGRYAFRLGYPFTGPAPLTLVGVQTGQTPSGRALRVLHVGPRTDIRRTYEKAYAYLAAHHLELRGDGLPWEVVLRGENATVDGEGDAAAADPAAPVRIEIYYPIQ
ncbi:MAG: hypothetical protein GC189_07130 [Alphaproteobacteria bacterium]|nr:hypothetical protein [Alphaproteobacteria bacterium]